MKPSEEIAAYNPILAVTSEGNAVIAFESRGSNGMKEN